jgi:hypothetical protein
VCSEGCGLSHVLSPDTGLYQKNAGFSCGAACPSARPSTQLELAVRRWGGEWGGSERSHRLALPEFRARC